MFLKPDKYNVTDIATTWKAFSRPKSPEVVLTPLEGTYYDLYREHMNTGSEVRHDDIQPAPLQYRSSTTTAYVTDGLPQNDGYFTPRDAHLEENPIDDSWPDPLDQEVAAKPSVARVGLGHLSAQAVESMVTVTFPVDLPVSRVA